MLKKPFVIEEFGKTREGDEPLSRRNRFLTTAFKDVEANMRRGGNVAGTSFWNWCVQEKRRQGERARTHASTHAPTHLPFPSLPFPSLPSLPLLSRSLFSFADSHASPMPILSLLSTPPPFSSFPFAPSPPLFSFLFSLFSFPFPFLFLQVRKGGWKGGPVRHLQQGRRHLRRDQNARHKGASFT